MNPQAAVEGPQRDRSKSQPGGVLYKALVKEGMGRLLHKKHLDRRRISTAARIDYVARLEGLSHGKPREVHEIRAALKMHRGDPASFLKKGRVYVPPPSSIAGRLYVRGDRAPSKNTGSLQK
jgi:hypothetical protein